MPAVAAAIGLHGIIEIMTEPIWEPSPERIQQSKMTEFIRYVADGWDASVVDYDTLYAFSVTHVAAFWDALWQFVGIIGDKGNDIVIDPERMPGAKWFPQARLNFAENLLRRRDDSVAVVARREDGSRRALSWRELYDAVSRFQQVLRSRGIRPGDRVVACLPNIPEAVIALLATTSIGAIWSCSSPDYGEQALIDRIGQIEPKMLIVSDGYQYGGKLFDLRAKTEELIRKMPSLECVVTVPYAGLTYGGGAGDRTIAWDDVMAPFTAQEIDFPRFPFDHPVYILYSSGTTGKPKAIIHCAGGCLVQGLKRIVLHGDIAQGERTFYHTNIGWVVWNHMLAALAWESSIVLYDGSPTYPRLDSLFDVIAEERVHAFRLVPALIESFKKAGLHPAQTHDLGSLKSIIAGSAPLLPHQYEYIYSKVKTDVFLFSPAGGTDSMGSLATGNPIGPVYAGEIQARGLGMKIEVFDEDGRSVTDQPGELVCTMSFPSIPLGFWGDVNNEQMINTYFTMFPGVWRHGDWARITPRGGVIIYGRSDATLNVNGVRIGTAEIYRGLEHIAEIKEAVAVAHRRNDGEQIVLFVILAAGHELGAALEERIKGDIRRSATARHVPGAIVQVTDVPRSLNGKPSEIAIRNIIHGRETSRLALSNPQALDLFRDIPELAL
jgi:acetoacetyl-CoA synthetase